MMAMLISVILIADLIGHHELQDFGIGRHGDNGGSLQGLNPLLLLAFLL